MKTIIIKLTKASPGTGMFTISDPYGNIIASDVPLSTLVEGISYSVDDNVDMITLSSTGKCKRVKTFPVTEISPLQLATQTFLQKKQSCLWKHLTTPSIYNSFYGNTEPYVIEYPFSYSFNDQILQSVKDYTKCYTYVSDSFSYADRKETNDYFNKAVLYNGQQSSGILNLVAKPKNSLRSYLLYPIHGDDSRTILYTKSDNLYQFNTFSNIATSQPLFSPSCESLSIDKVVNQLSMDYSKRSFHKEPLRAKDLKIRLSLTDRSDIHLVSQILFLNNQPSYK